MRDSILCVKYWINCALRYKTEPLRQMGERVSPQPLPSFNYKTSKFALHIYTASNGLQFRYSIWVSQLLVCVLIETQQHDENRRFPITNLDFPPSFLLKTTSAESLVVYVGFGFGWDVNRRVHFLSIKNRISKLTQWVLTSIKTAYKSRSYVKENTVRL